MKAKLRSKNSIKEYINSCAEEELALMTALSRKRRRGIVRFVDSTEEVNADTSARAESETVKQSFK